MTTNIHKLNGFIYVTSIKDKTESEEWYEFFKREVILTNDPNLPNVQQLTPEEEAYCKTVDSVGVDSFKLNFGAILYRLQLPKQKEMKATEIKAKELVDDFTFKCIECDYEQNAIQCAIICVEEIIKFHNTEFWQEVLTILKAM